MAFENYQDMRVGDVIECYRVETDAADAVSPNLTFALRIVADLAIEVDARPYCAGHPRLIGKCNGQTWIARL